MRRFLKADIVRALAGALLILALGTLSVGRSSGQPVSDDLKEKFDRVITLDLRDMDIIDVFKFVSLKGDFSVVLSKNVTGRVTLVLKKVRIVDALDILCLSNDLGYRIMENIIYIMPEEEYFQIYGKYFRDKTRVKIVYLKYTRPSYALEALKNVKSEIGKIVIDEDTGTIVMIDTEEKLDEMLDVLEKIDYKLDTRIYVLSHAKAGVVKEKLRERLDVKSVGTIEADERSNQIIITALPERFDEITPIVLALDMKTKEVLIKVMIIKIVLNPKYHAGIDWDTVLSATREIAFQSFGFSGAFPMASAISSVGNLGTIWVGNMPPDRVHMAIRAMKEVSDTKVLANPSILVTNEQEAKVHVGDKLAYVTTTTTGTGADQTTNEEVHFIDVGVLLTVTPTIGDDGYVRMKIKPEISSQTGTLETPQEAEIPLVNTTIVESNVMVKDGSTLIIGGLHKNEGDSQEQGMPYLMDLPLVGRLFKSVGDEVTNTEIAIFLTPHIVEGDINITGYRPKLSPLKGY